MKTDDNHFQIPYKISMKVMLILSTIYVRNMKLYITSRIRNVINRNFLIKWIFRNKNIINKKNRSSISENKKQTLFYVSKIAIIHRNEYLSFIQHHKYLSFIQKQFSSAQKLVSIDIEEPSRSKVKFLSSIECNTMTLIPKHISFVQLP